MKKGLIKTPEDIEKIAESGRILAEVLQKTARLVRPGLTTSELNDFAESEIRRMGGKPSFKGYGGKDNAFPAGLCTSINEVVVHGVPSRKDVLKSGDIIGLDLGVEFDGSFSDAAVTVPVGTVPKKVLDFIEVTRRALEAAISQAVPGNRIGDISSAIEKTARGAGYDVIRDLIGHGVGYAVHEDPAIPCYGKPGTGPVLAEGMVLAIEPMLVMGDFRVKSDPDDWPVLTADGSLSAHFEHTVAVANKGPRILTHP